jgi:hypothetical protein
MYTTQALSVPAVAATTSNPEAAANELRKDAGKMLGIPAAFVHAATFDRPEDLEAFLKDIQNPRVVVIDNTRMDRKLGHTSAQVAYWAHALLQHWPSIERLYVVDSNEDVMSLIDPVRCQACRREDLPALLSQAPADLYFDMETRFSRDKPLAKVTVHSLDDHFSGNNYGNPFSSDVSELTVPEYYVARVREMGLNTVSVHSPIVPRPPFQKGRIFINAQAQTQRETSKQLASSFSDLSERLALRPGITILSNDPSKIPSVNSLIEELSSSELVITVDSGVFHLARLLGIPTVVIMGDERSFEWISMNPQTQRSGRYRVVTREEFLNDVEAPLRAAEELLNEVSQDITASQPAAERAPELSKPTPPPLSVEVTFDHSRRRGISLNYWNGPTPHQIDEAIADALKRDDHGILSRPLKRLNVATDRPLKLEVHWVQAGNLNDIYQVKIVGTETKFGLVISRFDGPFPSEGTAKLLSPNETTIADAQNLHMLHDLDPRFVPEVYTTGRCNLTESPSTGRQGWLALFSVEWLDNMIEVNTSEEGYIVYNPYPYSDFPASDVDAFEIRTSIVHMIGRYFDLTYDEHLRSGLAIGGINLDAGDVVKKRTSNECPFITARTLVQMTPEQLIAYLIESPWRYEIVARESDPSSAAVSQIFLKKNRSPKKLIFRNISEIVNGLHRALAERHGDVAARQILQKWFLDYAVNRDADENPAGFRKADIDAALKVATAPTTSVTRDRWMHERDEKIDELEKDAARVALDSASGPEGAAARELSSLYPKLVPIATAIGRAIQKRMQIRSNINVGVDCYLVGGRLSGKSIKGDSDLDLKFELELATESGIQNIPLPDDAGFWIDIYKQADEIYKTFEIPERIHVMMPGRYMRGDIYAPYLLLDKILSAAAPDELSTDNSPHTIPEDLIEQWHISHNAISNNPFSTFNYSIDIIGNKTVEEVYGDLFRRVHRLMSQLQLKRFTLNRIINMTSTPPTIYLLNAEKDKALPVKIYDEEALLFEQHFPGYKVVSSVWGPGAAIQQHRHYDSRLTEVTAETKSGDMETIPANPQTQSVKIGEKTLTLNEILDGARELEERQHTHAHGRDWQPGVALFPFGIRFLSLESYVRNPAAAPKKSLKQNGSGTDEGMEPHSTRMLIGPILLLMGLFSSPGEYAYLFALSGIIVSVIPFLVARRPWLAWFHDQNAAHRVGYRPEDEESGEADETPVRRRPVSPPTQSTKIPKPAAPAAATKSHHPNSELCAA